MTWRGVLGIVGCLIGAVWIGQGLDLIKGSFMTGQGLWTVIGAVVFVAGVGLLGWEVARHRST